MIIMYYIVRILSKKFTATYPKRLNMKKPLYLLSMVLLLACLQVNAQQAKVEDIINSYIKNLGGADKWKELKSIKTTGTSTIQGAEYPMVLYRMPENKQRMEITAMGKQIVQAYDGTDAWVLNPLSGNISPVRMQEELAAEFKKDKFEDAFIDYKAKGHQAELVGKETIAGVDTYNIKFTHQNGDIKNYFFSAKDYLPVLIRTVVSEGPAKGTVSEVIISDYRKVDGLTVPFSMEVRTNGQGGQKFTIQEVAFNVPMAESIFAFPGTK